MFFPEDLHCFLERRGLEWERGLRETMCTQLLCPSFPQAYTTEAQMSHVG